jgi:hypothetical protein
MDIFFESCNRTKLLINYDVAKTLTENIIYEQPDSVMDRRIGIEDSNMKALGLDPNNLSDVKKYRQMTDPTFGTIEWMKTWDVHDWFTLVQLVLLYLGFFTGGASAIIAMALGTTVDVAESAIFWIKDKDPYMATVMLILSLLGVNDLMKIPTVKKLGIEGTKELIKKAKEGVERLTKEEIEDLKKLGQYIGKNSGEFISLTKKAIKTGITKYLSKKSLKWLLNLLIVLNKTKMPLLVAGTWITFDHFYIYVFRDDIKKMKLRNENTFIQIVKYVETLLSGKEIDNKQFVLDNIPMDSTTMVNNLAKTDTTIVDTKPILDSVLRAQGVTY